MTDENIINKWDESLKIPEVDSHRFLTIALPNITASHYVSNQFYIAVNNNDFESVIEILSSNGYSFTESDQSLKKPYGSGESVIEGNLYSQRPEYLKNESSNLFEGIISEISDLLNREVSNEISSSQSDDLLDQIFMKCYGILPTDSQVGFFERIYPFVDQTSIQGLIAESVSTVAICLKLATKMSNHPIFTNNPEKELDIDSMKKMIRIAASGFKGSIDSAGNTLERRISYEIVDDKISINLKDMKETSEAFRRKAEEIENLLKVFQSNNINVLVGSTSHNRGKHFSRDGATKGCPIYHLESGRELYDLIAQVMSKRIRP